MPVFEQGYRRFDGSLVRRSPVPSAVWHHVRTRMRWWIWLLTGALVMYPYVVFGVMIFIFTAGQSLMGGNAPTSLPSVTPVAYGLSGEPDPRVLMAMMTATSPSQALALYWSILEQSSLAAIVVPAVACGGILSTDRATGAMQIYFARPVTRFQYMLTKVFSVAFFTALVTAAPSLFIWLETVAFNANAGFLLLTWMAPFSILAASMFYALWSSSLVLALSSVLKRPVLTSIFSIFGYILLWRIGVVVSDGLDDLRWRIIDPGYALGGITAPLFGMDLPDWLATPWLAVPTIVIPFALLIFVWARIRAVEVTT